MTAPSVDLSALDALAEAATAEARKQPITEIVHFALHALGPHGATVTAKYWAARIVVMAEEMNRLAAEIEALRGENEKMRGALAQLRNIKAIQCDDGNWNYDAYMQGMANGLILAESVFTGEEAQFLAAPAEWLADRPAPETSTLDGATS